MRCPTRRAAPVGGSPAGSSRGRSHRGLPPTDVVSAARWRRLFCGSAGVLAALALVVYFRGSLPGEPAFYDAVRGWASPGGVTIFWWINWLGGKGVLVPAPLLIPWGGPPRTRRAG